MFFDASYVFADFAIFVYVFYVFEVFEVGCLDGCAGWPSGLLATWQAGSGAEIIGPGGGIGIMEAGSGIHI